MYKESPENMNAEKWLWLIFGCKVGQNVLIVMKLELGLWCLLLDVYIKFQIDISQHVENNHRKLW